VPTELRTDVLAPRRFRPKGYASSGTLSLLIGCKDSVSRPEHGSLTVQQLIEASSTSGLSKPRNLRQPTLPSHGGGCSSARPAPTSWSYEEAGSSSTTALQPSLTAISTSPEGASLLPSSESPHRPPTRARTDTRGPRVTSQFQQRATRSTVGRLLTCTSTVRTCAAIVRRFRLRAARWWVPVGRQRQGRVLL
jgi:hypothetical protein